MKLGSGCMWLHGFPSPLALGRAGLLPLLPQALLDARLLATNGAALTIDGENTPSTQSIAQHHSGHSFSSPEHLPC